jgi:Ca2+-binding EF-hand superfamily protein
LICLAEEFTKALNVITPELSDDDIRRVFHAVDINGDNQITYTEFLAATMDPLELDVGAVSRAFQLMDVNNDGYITAEELKKVLSVKFVDSQPGGPGKAKEKSKTKKNNANNPSGSSRSKRLSEKKSAKLSTKSAGAARTSNKQNNNNATNFASSKDPSRKYDVDAPPMTLSQSPRKAASMGSMLARSASRAGQMLLATAGAKSMLNLMANNKDEEDEDNMCAGKPDEEDNNNDGEYEDDDDEEDEDDEDVRVKTLEERIRDLMRSCDVDNDGVISYAGMYVFGVVSGLENANVRVVFVFTEFLWAMTGAKDLVGEISALGTQQVGDFHPAQRINSTAYVQNNQQDNNNNQQQQQQHDVLSGGVPISLPDAVTMDALLMDDNKMMSSAANVYAGVSNNNNNNGNNYNNNNNNSGIFSVGNKSGGLGSWVNGSVSQRMLMPGRQCTCVCEITLCVQFS